MEAVVFKNALPLMDPAAEKLTIAYYPEINEYQGRKSLQITIDEYKLH